MSRDTQRRAPLATASPWVATLLVAATFAAYARVGGNEFVRFDDPSYVYRNPHVRAGLSVEGTRWAFAETGASVANWHPLTWLSHMLDVQLFGLDAGLHHLVSVALHAASAVLLYLFLARASGRGGAAAFVAALFALHPLRVESVAWVSERKDVLAGLFFFLALLAHARHAADPRPRRMLMVALLHANGLLAKPTLVALPLVLLCLDRWPLGRRTSWTRLVLEKLPLFALSAGSAAMAIFAQRAGGALTSMDEVPLAARLANALAATGTYVARTVWPTGHAFFHPHPAFVEPGWAPGNPATLAGALLVVLVSALALRLRRSRPELAAGWGWFVALLLPVVGLVQVGEQAWAERYAYLSTVGLTIALVWTAARALDARPRLARPTALAGAAVLVLLGGLTYRASGYWRDSETLFTRALAVTERNYVAHTALANVLSDRGEREPARGHYERALAIKPDHVEALYGLGLVAQEEGSLDDAETLYRQALAEHPALVEARVNLAAVLAASGRLDAAIEELALVLALEPEHPLARRNLDGLARELVAAGKRRSPADDRRLARVREVLEALP